MFVLLMLFLWKYIDDLIGKGFEWYTILQLLMYASATNVAMALPLSVLLSSIMTYGTLGENYELVAIKAAGISLARALYPMVIVVALLAVGAFIFSEYMLPVANLKYFSLLYDARKQKSASLIKENVFNNSFPGYSIRVKRKDPDGQRLYDVMIYQRNNTATNNTVTFAKEGKMYRTPDNNYLVLRLKDGIRYEENASDKGLYNPRQTFTRYSFNETVQKLDLSDFKFKRTNESEFKSAFQMLNSKQLLSQHDSVNKQFNKGLQTILPQITPYIKYFSLNKKPIKGPPAIIKRGRVLSLIPAKDQLLAINNATTEARNIKDMIKARGDNYNDQKNTVQRYLIEYQKKFTLSAACLVLFLIGAPLGAIIRKGGLGLPVVISVIFFLIYYIIATIGEKSAKDGSLSPVLGTWISIFILFPIGLFLSYKAANDSVLFDAEVYKQFFVKLFKRRKPEPM
jgi:lipopolysaccharide export system permease protein